MMPQFFLWLGILLSVSYVPVYYLERELIQSLINVNIDDLLIASYVTCIASILYLVAARLWVRSAAMMADDGFGLASGLVGFSVLAGGMGLVARFDSSFARFDIEMSAVSMNPSEIFLYSFLSLPAFILLRLFAQALDAYVKRFKG